MRFSNNVGNFFIAESENHRLLTVLVRRTTGMLLITSNFQLDCEIHSDRQRAGRNQKSDAMKFHVDYRSLNCRNSRKSFVFKRNYFRDSTRRNENSQHKIPNYALLSWPRFQSGQSRQSQREKLSKSTVRVDLGAGWCMTESASDDSLSRALQKHNLHSIENECHCHRDGI